MKKTISSLILSLLLPIYFQAQTRIDTVFTHADQMPYFPGCEYHDAGTEIKRQCSDKALVRFIAKNLVYPVQAQEEGIEGVVYVSFIIDENGFVTEPRLLMDIGGGCGQEALQVIREMPKWEPARNEGEAVKAKLNLPVQFSLKSTQTDASDRYTLTWGSLHGKTAGQEEIVKNLEHPVLVRDEFGNDLFVDELAFTFEKSKRVLFASSRSEISDELAKIAQKAKNGGTFTITASVQDKGQFVYVTRTFSVL